MSNARKLQAAAVAGTVTVLSLGVLSMPAMADYAPGANDIVGVGSDTVQYVMDFMADGDNLGDPGYNSAGNLNRVINFDATPDANARLAYGPGGASGVCNNGTGSGAGTGHPGTSAGTSPCILNPTIVTRAGTNPVQRPNGSGAGFSAILNDTSAPYEINYVRASSAASSSQESLAVTEFGGAGLDSVVVGTDRLAMVGQNAGGTNAVALSTAQLLNIYKNCTNLTWTANGGTSSDAIIPVAPQLGSGTLKTFEQDLNGGNTFTLGSCVKIGEENDPLALFANYSAGTVAAATASSGSTSMTVPAGTGIYVGDTVSGTGIATGTTVAAYNSGTGAVTLSTATTAAVSGASFHTNAKDVIEPMSGGRLNLWLGISGSGGSTGGGGYFLDPTNAWNKESAADVTANVIVPDVSYLSGTPSDSNPIYNHVRNLYVYFRDSDVNSTTIFQPGGTQNWVRTLLYNPCSGAGHTSGCTTVGSNTFGPGGAPFIASNAGQSLIASAGVTPAYSVNIGS